MADCRSRVGRRSTDVARRGLSSPASWTEAPRTGRTMFRGIQELVDDLADDLDRAVVVEDERHALIAHSPHRRDVDPIRERSVFDRQTPSEMVKWVTAQGL